MDETIRRLVQRERLKRAVSIRTIAKMGGISNTAWAYYENGSRPLTPKLQIAVARAYGWKLSWPVDMLPPEGKLPPATAEEVLSMIAELNRRVDEQADQILVLTRLLGGKTEGRHHAGAAGDRSVRPADDQSPPAFAKSRH